jgi:DNA adenine methylase
LSPPLKWHGGKHYLAKRIVALMPPQLHYVEPFAGGLAVLLARDPEGVSEVINDLHGDLTNFFRVVQGEETFATFRRVLEAMPFSEVEWQDACTHLAERPDAEPVQRAVWFFVVNRMSLAGRMDTFTAVTRTRTRRSMNGEVSAWLSAVEGLPAVHARLRRVLVLNRPALQVDPPAGRPADALLLRPALPARDPHGSRRVRPAGNVPGRPPGVPGHHPRCPGESDGQRLPLGAV